VAVDISSNSFVWLADWVALESPFGGAHVYVGVYDIDRSNSLDEKPEES